MRRVSSLGGFATVLRKGNSEAGAIFVVMRNLQHSCTLLAPAPQAMVTDSLGEDRIFDLVLDNRSEAEIDSYVERMGRMDPDLWLLEIEHLSLEQAGLTIVS